MNTAHDNITRDSHLPEDERLYGSWTNLFMRSVDYRASHGMHAWSPPPILRVLPTMATALSA